MAKEFYVLFETVAAKAAGFELRARLTADLGEPTSSLALDGNLNQIVESLKHNFKEALQSDQWDRLDLARKVRNKLYHGELHKACELVEAPTGGVFSIDLSDTNDGSEILRRIQEQQGELVEGRTTKQVGVFGWLLESHSSGAFILMLRLFEDACNYMSKVAIHRQS